MTVKCMLRDSIDCPSCDGVSHLKKTNWSGFSNSENISFFYDSLSYLCDGCGHCTTNESDEITMTWYNISKRREIRKYKINKLNEYFW